MLGSLAAIACVMWRMALLWREQHRYASFHDQQGLPVPVEGDVSLQKLESGTRRKKKERGVGAGAAAAVGEKGSGGGGGGIPSTEAVTEAEVGVEEAQEA